jgi:hypothetical protein
MGQPVTAPGYHRQDAAVPRLAVAGSALLRHVPPQGAAPQVGVPPAAPGPIRRCRRPSARHLRRRRLQEPRGRRLGRHNVRRRGISTTMTWGWRSPEEGAAGSSTTWTSRGWLRIPSSSIPWNSTSSSAITATGSVCNDTASNVDFAATWLDQVELKVPSYMQGRSFRPLTRGKTPSNW